LPFVLKRSEVSENQISLEVTETGKVKMKNANANEIIANEMDEIRQVAELSEESTIERYFRFSAMKSKNLSSI
jgi:fumarate hydratase class II